MSAVRAALPIAIAEAMKRPGLSADEEEVLSVVEASISDEAGASSALTLDRLRALAKAEWAVSKLYGRWPLPSGKVRWDSHRLCRFFTQRWMCACTCVSACMCLFLCICLGLSAWVNA